MGVLSGKLTSDETAALLTAIGPALLQEPLFKRLVRPVSGNNTSIITPNPQIKPEFNELNALFSAALMKLRHYLCQEIHTDASIKEVERLATKFIETLHEDLPEIRGGNKWKLPKIFRIKLFSVFIKKVGCAMVTNTGPQERSHKDLKESNRHTSMVSRAPLPEKMLCCHSLYVVFIINIMLCS